MSGRNPMHVVDRLSPYLEGELDRAEHLQVEEHLDRCARCHRELRLLESAGRFLEAPVELSSEREFLRRLDARIDGTGAMNGFPISPSRAEVRDPDPPDERAAPTLRMKLVTPARVAGGLAAAAALTMAAILVDPSGEREAGGPSASEPAGVPERSGIASPPSAIDSRAAQLARHEGIAPVADGPGAASAIESAGAPPAFEFSGRVEAPVRWYVASPAPDAVRRRLLELARSRSGFHVTDQDEWSVTLSLPASMLPSVHEQIVAMANTRAVRGGSGSHGPGGRVLLQIRFDGDLQASPGT